MEIWGEIILLAEHGGMKNYTQNMEQIKSCNYLLSYDKNNKNDPQKSIVNKKDQH